MISFMQSLVTGALSSKLAEKASLELILLIGLLLIGSTVLITMFVPRAKRLLT